LEEKPKLVSKNGFKFQKYSNLTCLENNKGWTLLHKGNDCKYFHPGYPASKMFCENKILKIVEYENNIW
jgi:hypothetical protein